MKNLVPKVASWDLDSWEDDVPENIGSSRKVEKVLKEDKLCKTHDKLCKTHVPSVVVYKDRYEYLAPSIMTTVLKTLFPKSTHPVRDLNETMSMARLEEYIRTVRNGYLLPTYYVLRSTRFFNPIAKKILLRSKKEYVDPNYHWVSLEDQRRVYNLFGLSGNQSYDDILREEIQEYLKTLLFKSNHLCALISHLMKCMEIKVDVCDIQEMCQQLEKMPEYTHKSYKLPEKWFHDSKWKPLKRKVIIIGGEGGRGMVEEYQ